MCSGEQAKQIGWTMCGSIMNAVESGRVMMNIDSSCIKKQV